MFLFANGMQRNKSQKNSLLAFHQKQKQKQFSSKQILMIQLIVWTKILRHPLAQSYFHTTLDKFQVHYLIIARLNSNIKSVTMIEKLLGYYENIIKCFYVFVERYVFHPSCDLNTSREILNWFRKVSTFIFLDMILYA